MLGFECTSKAQIQCLRNYLDACYIYGLAFSADYTFSHMKNGWVLGIAFARSVVHQPNGMPVHKAIPIVLQVRTCPMFLGLKNTRIQPQRGGRNAQTHERTDWANKRRTNTHPYSRVFTHTLLLSY